MYIVIPDVTVAILALVPLPLNVKIGVILLVISPAVATSLPAMLAFGANPPYVYSLLIFISLLAVVTVPISLGVLTAMPLAHDASVPPFEVVKLLAQTVLLPLVIGAFTARLAPRWVERFGQRINPFAGKVLLATLLALLALNFSSVLEVGILSFMVVLAVAALVAGHLQGGPTFGDRVALAMASAQRNTAIALLIAAINFPGQKPSSTLSFTKSQLCSQPSHIRNGAKSG
jgi:bile acid:Na+ symporter, BASS family